MKPYKKISGILSLLMLASWAGAANALVVGGPANQDNCFPFGCADGWTPVYQQVYDASEFGGPIAISSLSFYQRAVYPNDINPALGTFTIQLSTTSASVDGLSTTTSNNLGADNTTVFTGSLPAAPAPGGQWDILLDSVFSYTPAQGNLLLTVTVTNPSETSPGLSLDSNSDNADGISRVFGIGITNTSGLVTGFNEADIPPPSSPPTPKAVPTMPIYGIVLVILGLLLLATLRLRMSAKQD